MRECVWLGTAANSNPTCGFALSTASSNTSGRNSANSGNARFLLEGSSENGLHGNPDCDDNGTQGRVPPSHCPGIWLIPPHGSRSVRHEGGAELRPLILPILKDLSSLQVLPYIVQAQFVQCLLGWNALAVPPFEFVKPVNPGFPISTYHETSRPSLPCRQWYIRGMRLSK